MYNDNGGIFYGILTSLTPLGIYNEIKEKRQEIRVEGDWKKWKILRGKKLRKFLPFTKPNPCCASHVSLSLINVYTTRFFLLPKLARLILEYKTKLMC